MSQSYRLKLFKIVKYVVLSDYLKWNKTNIHYAAFVKYGHCVK